MRLCRDEAQYVLDRFHIAENVFACTPIQENFSIGCVRLIYIIQTREGGRWICRLTDDVHYPKHIIEKQSIFASLLYKNGVRTPFKVQADGKYCLTMELRQKTLNVTLETFYGRDLDYVNVEVFRWVGMLLGKMHAISEKFPVRIGSSTISGAIQNNRADLSFVFKRELPHFLQDSRAHVLIKMHNSLVKDLQNIWNTLPKGAVHGDLGVFNNLVEASGGIGVIDFHLAGDEVYLGELLISFYSSIHKFTWRDKLSFIQLDEAYTAFLSGYSEERKLTLKELSVFPVVSALFDGLFYCKAVIEAYNVSKNPRNLKKFNDAAIHFSVTAHPVPQEVR